MTTLLLRALRLWKSNPRLFYRRLWMAARSPRHVIGEVIAPGRQSRRVQESYERWLRIRNDGTGQPAAAPAEDTPLLSVIMPVYNTDADVLAAAIDSVLRQEYQHWELCIADDASPAQHTRLLLERYAAEDARIRVVWRDTQGHIAAASNSAIFVARGEFIVLLDHDDQLTPDALTEVARVISSDSQVDFVYSDEDKLDFGGERIEPFFKPAWSPTLLTCCNYITHLAALRRSLVLQVGGFRDVAVGSQDHDLFLRVSEHSRAIAHIPRVLYSWRKTATSTSVASVAKPYAVKAAQLAIQETIERRGLDAYLQPSHLNGIFVVRHRLKSPARVSLVVEGESDLWQSVIDARDIQVCDVTFLDNPHASSRGIPVAQSINSLTGEFLLWVDSCAQPSNPHCVMPLLEQAQLHHVGVAGGVITDRASGHILEGAVAIGADGQPASCFAGLPRIPYANFYLNLKDLPREVSAVSVACCAMRRGLWDQLHGWRTDLPIALAMIDLCLRVQERGYRNVYMPLAAFRSSQRRRSLPAVRSVNWPWHEYRDPFWNPNLTAGSPDGLPFQTDTDLRHRILPACEGRDPIHLGAHASDQNLLT